MFQTTNQMNNEHQHLSRHIPSIRGYLHIGVWFNHTLSLNIGTPSHPNFRGIFHEINHPAFGVAP